MPTTCQFKFSRTMPIFYNGERITGSVILSTTKQLPVEAIKLSLVGTERVQWLEKSVDALFLHNDSIEKDTKELYYGKQEHLYESYTLAEAVRLQSGEVRVENFCFTLPHDAQASCDMIYGGVVYYVQLVLQCKSVFNKVFKARIAVKNRLDLSDAERLIEPHALTIAGVSSNVLESESLNFTLSTGTGYVPGQTIAYTLRGRHTFAACNRLRVNFCQLNIFRSISPQTKIKELLKVLNSDSKKICSSYVTECGELSIPLVAHIALQKNTNNLIQISHYVEALLINKKRILQKFIVPVIIGTVPPMKTQLTPEEKCLKDVEYSYCYDNLATDEICESSIESDYLPTQPSPLLLGSWALSEDLLQQHVAKGSSQLTLSKTSILSRLQPQPIQQECLM